MWEKEPVFKAVCKVVQETNKTRAGLGLRKARRGKSSMKLMNQKTMVWMI